MKISLHFRSRNHFISGVATKRHESRGTEGDGKKETARKMLCRAPGVFDRVSMTPECNVLIGNV